MIGQAKPAPQPDAAGPTTSPASHSDGAPAARETGGRDGSVSAGLDPTRYGDWEKNGRCIDF